jgi:hypothetical protein
MTDTTQVSSSSLSSSSSESSSSLPIRPMPVLQFQSQSQLPSLKRLREEDKTIEASTSITNAETTTTTQSIDEPSFKKTKLNHTGVTIPANSVGSVTRGGRWRTNKLTQLIAMINAMKKYQSRACALINEKFVSFVANRNSGAPDHAYIDLTLAKSWWDSYDVNVPDEHPIMMSISLSDMYEQMTSMKLRDGASWIEFQCTEQNGETKFGLHYSVDGKEYVLYSMRISTDLDEIKGIWPSIPDDIEHAGGILISTQILHKVVGTIAKTIRSKKLTLKIEQDQQFEVSAPKFTKKFDCNNITHATQLAEIGINAPPPLNDESLNWSSSSSSSSSLSSLSTAGPIIPTVNKCGSFLVDDIANACDHKIESYVMLNLEEFKPLIMTFFFHRNQSWLKILITSQEIRSDERLENE